MTLEVLMHDSVSTLWHARAGFPSDQGIWLGAEIVVAPLGACRVEGYAVRKPYSDERVPRGWVVIDLDLIVLGSE